MKSSSYQRGLTHGHTDTEVRKENRHKINCSQRVIVFCQYNMMIDVLLSFLYSSSYQLFYIEQVLL